MLKMTFATLLLATATSAFAIPFSSQSALVIEESTGKILLEKDAGKIVSIASLTKLMTAMVVLDAKLDMEAPISIAQSDVDMLKHSSSRVPVGVTLPRKSILHLALMSSDNRAAASLARTYPGGNAAFITALHAKLVALGMMHTVIEEPTGLSPRNTSTATDLIKMAVAAGQYPEIAHATTEQQDQFNINGRSVNYHNTNHFVGQKGWDILLSKTGYTMEAGRCIIMRVKAAGKNVVMVLLNANASSARSVDAVRVQRFLSGDTSVEQPRRVRVMTAKHRAVRHRGRLVQVAAL
jgi:D-alanyl-D-alanine endopeptidase (penicillin-binding protein 7)